MARLRLLPGERELVRLRPTAGAWLGRYILATGWAAWGAALLWAPGLAGLKLTTALALVFAGPAFVASLLYLPRRRHVRLGLVFLAAASCAFVGVTQRLDAVAASLAVAGVMAFALAEADRRLRTYHLTNVRVVHEGGLWDKAGWTLHYDAILDVDQKQGPLGRVLGYGTLEPVLRNPTKTVAAPTKRRKVAVPAMSDITVRADPHLVHVGPLRKVRHLLTCFVQDATATPYLREEQQTGRRVAQAIKDVGRANVLH